jgi:hypothetical protein
VAIIRLMQGKLIRMEIQPVIWNNLDRPGEMNAAMYRCNGSGNPQQVTQVQSYPPAEMHKFFTAMQERRNDLWMSLPQVERQAKSCCGGAVAAVVGAAKIIQSRAGIGIAPDEVIESRRRTCEACERWNHGQCSACGCYTLDKTRLARESCPETPPKWTQYSKDATDDPVPVPLGTA